MNLNLLFCTILVVLATNNPAAVSAERITNERGTGGVEQGTLVSYFVKNNYLY